MGLKTNYVGKNRGRTSTLWVIFNPLPHTTRGAVCGGTAVLTPGRGAETARKLYNLSIYDKPLFTWGNTSVCLGLVTSQINVC